MKRSGLRPILGAYRALPPAAASFGASPEPSDPHHSPLQRPERRAAMRPKNTNDLPVPRPAADRLRTTPAMYTSKGACAWAPGHRPSLGGAPPRPGAAHPAAEPRAKRRARAGHRRGPHGPPVLRSGRSVAATSIQVRKEGYEAGVRPRACRTRLSGPRWKVSPWREELTPLGGGHPVRRPSRKMGLCRTAAGVWSARVRRPQDRPDDHEWSAPALDVAGPRLTNCLVPYPVTNR